MAKSNEKLSLSEEIEMYGVKIRKMPNGQYFKALKLIKELPESFVKEVMQEKTDLKLSNMLDAENIATLVEILITSVPEFVIKFLAKLMNVDEKVLIDEVTPAETIEIVQKFWEINKLESFFQKMKSIVGKITTLIGFKEQSPFVPKSE